MASPLRSLLNIIQKSVDEIEDVFEKHGSTFPSIDDTQHQDDAIRLDPSVQAAATLLTSAAYQLISNVQRPQSNIFNAVFQHYLPCAIRAAVETNVVEILREAGPKGMHVKKIAEQCGVNHIRLSSILCYLATHHIFREVEPDVYVNNALSIVWDTGKSLKEIKTRYACYPSHKYPSFSYGCGSSTDESYKAAGYIPEHLIDPATTFADAPESSPMMLAVGYRKAENSMWTWFEQPSNEMRLRRFGMAMNGVVNLEPPYDILTGFDWGILPKGSVIVDVGGGVGSYCIAIARAFAGLKFIVQDRPMTVKLGAEHCLKEFPDALNSGQIQYQEHDFFETQPQTSASVFLLKQIMHDWSDRYAACILRRLRDAAMPATILCLNEALNLHTCPAPLLPIPGAHIPSPPSPLLTNLGPAKARTNVMDLVMHAHVSGRERTLVEFVELLASTGWKVVQVYHGEYNSQIIAAPIQS
ncbi:O-methyltransferase [Gymnopus androsaceus JB14]|uniref:O-methyltransferase n=1 Tax=Gymnopus androsaceus JB14 TaxID=1447944 RepID=A0A6A4HUP3_9AGAR|nr:O-methyltransferase [Gymnopus androsaceus JB14]